MQIKLAKTAGFCFGVNRAVELLYDKVEAGERVCTLGPIIHNAQLVGDLAERGVKIIDRVEDCPPGYQIVVRTHGVDKCVVEEMEARHLPFTDATCPFVLKIHRIVGASRRTPRCSLPETRITRKWLVFDLIAPAPVMCLKMPRNCRRS